MQLGWNRAINDVLGQAFNDRSLTNPGFPNQDWVVLSPPVQDFDDASDFLVPANNGVNLALFSEGG